MSSYTITEGVRKTLEESFVEERDLLDAVREERGDGAALPAEGLELTVILTVRRPMDLETAELRKVSVRLRPVEEGFEVFALDGLPDGPVTPGS